MTLTVGSLFSGVGGFDLGFARAGFPVAWQCEIDPSCRDVLARNFPDVEVVYSNVLTIDRHMLAPVDIIIGGFPCQDLSVAGRRAGLGGERSGLFFEFMRIVRELRPTFVVIENVPGLLSSDEQRDFTVVLGTLRELGAVDIAWRVLDAQWFGVAQRRRRVFIVADFGGERAGEILALSEGVSGYPPPRRETGQRTAPFAIRRAQTGSNGRGVSEDATHSLDGSQGDAIVGTIDCRNDVFNPDLSGTVQTKANGGQSLNYINPVAIAQNQRGELRTAAIMPQLTTGGGKPGEGYPAIAFGVEGNETGFALRANASHSGDKGDGGINTTMVAFSNRVGASDAVTETLRSDSHGDSPMTVAPMAVRRLMPEECEKLMGWPPGWTAYGASGKEMADSTRYRMCGNGVVASVSEWIARRILAVTA